MLVRPAEESFRKGVEAFEGGRGLEALALFEAAVELDKRFNARSEPRHLSYYGLCLAVEKRDVGQGLLLCQEALAMEFYNADLYCNLGRAYLVASRKREAHQVFREGLMWESNNARLLRELRAMGRRRKPAIPFLARANPINRFLGRMSSSR